MILSLAASLPSVVLVLPPTQLPPTHAGLRPVHSPRALVVAEATTTDASRYGIDPRLANPEAVAEAPEWSAGRVGDLKTTGELRAAVEAAAADGGFVCLKFWREGCAACASTAERFEQSAEANPHGRFFLVNYGRAKEMCRATGIRVVPAAHLYARGSLVAALPLGPSKWEAFAERLAAVAAETS
ncbi:hypothetical protein EMIHUDRAFT_255364 [Emiliania huxleyi CCMP1516]|uniref:Thioredoxin domain-containing protein n=3 Tax=Emiliania huxleyi TaxID=2903 RepID=A0A0D3I424_EMIH1|nr:hypothetical protein EMIHUDRAFT_250080 [Emiliania huxleyi CCMP1516]XP_005773549.1 hypothetical protein EMIHUDRAFT_255364 [Emiliania huxleyi CCMP1516]EOD06009.1 hypothetical protein EMIHUDRAFT_250080 [Emiliania huxleyi CCMP1516]EOD21120.1 hypothetical protein EMIHUDRAFT_255364 [Emiliania huxleyi CCMP1516]|eukprot:XP_005758438.1 hypothetical protein EMIHUDRAFT_250080 [Emiliania huxleyi CCMP1516]